MECQFIDKSKSKFVKATDKCNKCNLKLLPTGFDFKPKDIHICHESANERFCSYHRSKDGYLFVPERIVFDFKDSEEQSNIINHSENFLHDSASIASEIFEKYLNNSNYSNSEASLVEKIKVWATFIAY